MHLVISTNSHRLWHTSPNACVYLHTGTHISHIYTSGKHSIPGKDVFTQIILPAVSGSPERVSGSSRSRGEWATAFHQLALSVPASCPVVVLSVATKRRPGPTFPWFCWSAPSCSRSLGRAARLLALQQQPWRILCIRTAHSTTPE